MNASEKDTTSRSDEQPGYGCRWRRTSDFWIIEAAAIAAILLVVLLLQYGEEGYLRRNGIRVTATVDELPLGKDSCKRCPLLFTIEGELHDVEETLSDSSDERRYFPGEAVDLYVDPDDMTHAIEVKAIEENVADGVFVIAVAAVFAFAWPVYEFKRTFPPSIARAPD